jgi:predicted CoA-binding protein
MNKTTLVIGASENPDRYANKALKLLLSNQHTVHAFGKQKGEVSGVKIETAMENFRGADIDTVTLYLNPTNQEKYYQDIIDLKPARVIFNPGTENDVFQDMLQKADIDFEEACTLVLLHTGQY